MLRVGQFIEKENQICQQLEKLGDEEGLQMGTGFLQGDEYVPE